MSATAKPTYRQAITTRYLGPTNARGSRIRAACDAGSITVPYDHALGIEDNHAAAVVALANKLGWNDTDWCGGATKAGYVWVAPEKVR